MKKTMLLAASLALLSNMPVQANETVIDQNLVLANIQQALVENLADIAAENVSSDGYALVVNIPNYTVVANTDQQEKPRTNTRRVIAD